MASGLRTASRKRSRFRFPKIAQRSFSDAFDRVDLELSKCAPIMKRERSSIIDALLKSDEPSVRWKVMTRVVGEDPESRKVRELREEIRTSPRARALIAGRDKRFVREPYVYAKWRGAHWTLAMLAEIGYPAGDESILPMREQVLDCWLNSSFYLEFEAKSAVPKHRSAEGVPIIQGRYRRCASQQGNALYSITRLGLADKKSDGLAERLMHWQWPDGGWNCDRKPSAHVSSFNESLLPMLGLAAHAERAKDDAARAAALKASEIFLCRRLFKSQTDGKVISRIGCGRSIPGTGITTCSAGWWRWRRWGCSRIRDAPTRSICSSARNCRKADGQRSGGSTKCRRAWI
jgi:hypothetical protein